MIPEAEFTVPYSLIEKTMTYLWQRPMVEVYDMFNEWNKLLKAQQKVKAESAPSAKPTNLIHRDQLIKGESLL